MGCDIHCYAEIKKNGKWEKVGKIFKNPYYNPERENYVDEDGFEWNAPLTDEPYNGRNYNLFAVLADVRNGRGFAGVVTGGGFNPISEPKGLPDDVSEDVKKKSDEWGGDGHSHSYFTLSELLNYDYNQLTTHTGWVSPSEYKTFLENGKPESWCGGVSGGAVKHISNEEMNVLIKPKKLKSKTSYYTQVQWGSTYMDSIGNYWFDETLPALDKLGNPDEVRIVFWFDN